MYFLKQLTKHFRLEVDEDSKELYENHGVYHEGDSGLDLYVTKDLEIGSGETVLVGTGVKVQCARISWCVWKWLSGEFYEYYSYLLLPRSSISKTPLVFHNSIGLIDKSYVGEIKLALRNTSYEPYVIKRGERYGQLVMSDLRQARMLLVDNTRQTTRGESGFGSTGN